MSISEDLSRKRVLICANPDLNYIDGSSVWAQTFALALAEAGAEVHLLARSTPRRYELFGALASHPSIRIIDGVREQGFRKQMFSKKLGPSGIRAAVNQLDKRHNYDVLVVRGIDIAAAIFDFPSLRSKTWLYLTDIPQNIHDYSADQQKLMRKFARRSARVLCQTPAFLELWQSLAPQVPKSKFSLYTPVIPNFDDDDVPPIAQRPRRAVYAGKFKPEWMTLEMARIWPKIHAELPTAEFHVIGDKFNVDYPEFRPEMTEALQHSPGLKWAGALPRETVYAELTCARVGLSWRAESMNSSVELSTKILEYGAAGCAVILNRNPLHEELLGPDYPLFANSAEEFERALQTALTDEAATQTAADRLKAVAAEHTLDKRAATLATWLAETPDPQPRGIEIVERPLRILVAGHDLKFFHGLQNRLEKEGPFEFIVDQWKGHNTHDKAKSLELLPQADIIFAEWCLGNLEWYSKHRLPHQRLVARFHLQERERPYLHDALTERIDHIAYVSDYIHAEGQRVFDFPVERTSVIPNFLDDEKFKPTRKTGDALFTLGLVGAAPARKRLDRAVDLLEILLEKDSRYCLRVKGRHPLEYPWLAKDPSERRYYEDLFERINSSPTLSHRVIFDPPGDDVNSWFSMVGFILSPSDFESFHMAVGEGILAGSTPIIWDWSGARDIWGDEHVITTTEEAAENILRHDPQNTTQLPQSLAPQVVTESWIRVLRGTPELHP